MAAVHRLSSFAQGCENTMDYAHFEGPHFCFAWSHYYAIGGIQRRRVVRECCLDLQVFHVRGAQP